jgi:hypothetical protein
VVVLVLAQNVKHRREKHMCKRTKEHWKYTHLVVHSFVCVFRNLQRFILFLLPCDGLSLPKGLQLRPDAAMGRDAHHSKPTAHGLTEEKEEETVEI